MKGSAAKTATCMRACSVTLVMSGSAIPWTVACQTLLSMEWVAMTSSMGDLTDPGIKSASFAAPALQADSLFRSHWGSPNSNNRI